MSKIIKFAIILLAIVSLSATSNLQAQGWTEIANTKISDVAINYPSSIFVVVAWSGAIWDSFRNRMIIWGGGHGDYSGNEQYAVNLGGTPSATRISDPGSGGCSQPTCDGGVTANARHTYHVITYMANIDSMFVFSGALSGDGFGDLDTWLYHYSTSSWQQLFPSGPIPATSPSGGSGIGPCSEYDSATGKVFVWDGSSLYSWDHTTNAYTGLYISANGWASTGVCTIDPGRRRMYILDTNDHMLKYLDLASGGDPRHVVTPQPTGATAWLMGDTMAYDSSTTNFVSWTGGNNVYTYDPDTNVSTGYTGFTGGPTSGCPEGTCTVNAEQDRGTYGRWQYAPSLNAFVVVNSINENAFTFSLGAPPPPDTTPPTTPDNISATAISASQINLSWTASTDDVAVTAYLIERATGAGGSFSQIAAPSGTTYSSTSLASSTLYRYRIRATDAAGNLSPYSTIASATTDASSGVITVGSGKTYATICAAIAAAASGSTIEIDAAIYPNEYCTVSQNSLTLRGVGGRAHMKWGTGNYLTNSTTIPNGKGMIITAGTAIDLIVENMEFSGAKVDDANGAGIRYSNSGDLTIRNCYFHNNENGILGQGGPNDTLLIEYSIFDTNGYIVDGFTSHNVYIGQMGKMIFRYNASINSHEGHTLKSRASVNEVYANFFSTKTSDGSYEAEFPYGGAVYFVGNVIEQGDNTDNSTILGFALEGAVNSIQTLCVVNNTFYNWRTNGATFVQVNGSPTLAIRNNIWGGGGTPLVGGSTDLSSNLALTSSAFINADAGDYHLVSGAAAVNSGVAPGLCNSYDLTPLWEYVSLANKTARASVGTIDVGAYESDVSDSPAALAPSGRLRFRN